MGFLCGNLLFFPFFLFPLFLLAVVFFITCFRAWTGGGKEKFLGVIFAYLLVDN